MISSLWWVCCFKCWSCGSSARTAITPFVVFLLQLFAARSMVLQQSGLEVRVSIIFLDVNHIFRRSCASINLTWIPQRLFPCNSTLFPRAAVHFVAKLCRKQLAKTLLLLQRTDSRIYMWLTEEYMWLTTEYVWLTTEYMWLTAEYMWLTTEYMCWQQNICDWQ
jgi:hypothetical protein